jgi:hypothetical protein
MHVIVAIADVRQAPSILSSAHVIMLHHDLPAGTPWSYENLARRCWSVSPDSRGPIKSVLMELDGIKVSL